MRPFSLNRLTQASLTSCSIPRLLVLIAGWCFAAPSWLLGLHLIFEMGTHTIPILTIFLFAIWHLAWWLVMGYWAFRQWHWPLWGMAALLALFWVKSLHAWGMGAWPMHFAMLIATIDAIWLEVEQYLKKQNPR